MPQKKKEVSLSHEVTWMKRRLRSEWTATAEKLEMSLLVAAITMSVPKQPLAKLRQFYQVGCNDPNI